MTPSLIPQALADKHKPLYRSREQLKDGVTLTSKSTDIYNIIYNIAVDPISPLLIRILYFGLQVT